MFRRMLVACTIVGLCLGLLPGALGSSVAAQATPMAQGTPCAIDTEDAIRTIVTEFNDAYNAHDAQAMAALASADLVRHSPRGDTVGADAMADVHRIQTVDQMLGDLRNIPSTPGPMRHSGPFVRAF